MKNNISLKGKGKNAISEKKLSQDTYCIQSACAVKFAYCCCWNISFLTLDLRVITYSVKPLSGFQAFCVAGIQGTPNYLDLNIKEDTLRPLSFSLYFHNWFHIIYFFRCTWVASILERGALRDAHSSCWWVIMSTSRVFECYSVLYWLLRTWDFQ